MQYDLIDKELKSSYVTLPKYMFLFFLFVSFVFGILLLFNKSDGNIFFFVTFLIIAFAILMTWTVNKKWFGKKLALTMMK